MSTIGGIKDGDIGGSAEGHSTRELIGNSFL
jgi:hypothetical protein